MQNITELIEKVINEERVKQSKIAKAKFEIEDYKHDVQEANAEKEVLAEVTKNVQRVNTIIIVAVVFLIITLVTLFIIYLSKKKLSGILQAQNEQLEIAKFWDCNPNISAEITLISINTGDDGSFK